MPTASFTFNETGNVISYNNTSTNANTYLWTFGDGETSMDENPSHTYADDGTYIVTLEATNACGTVATQETVTIITPVTAGFSADITSGCAGLEVQFTDASSNNVTGWNWTFLGGIPSTSTEQNPTVVYNSAGTFDVNLEVTNPAGTSSVEQTSYITVSENPMADFIVTVNMDGNVDFINNSNFGDSYEWIFGDGNTSLENAPNYTYDTSGLYIVQLIVTNSCGSDMMTQEILIDITGVEDVTFLEKFDLFPNPNNGDFTLHIEGQPLDELEVSLYNILGQRIFQEQIDFISGQLIKDYQLSRLAAATYILQIKSCLLYTSPSPRD